ncbi:MAG: SDR family NAD(P)-dependent oxidoreductase, partial [Spirochaetales bacterium]|nr:SDR family NAD(P)-dependent oxidoreductase [Spirochaetales bacterium]
MGTKRFEKKSIVITGGAGDIGLATAVRFGKEGADVALIDLKDMSQAKKRVEETGVTVKTYHCDVTDYLQVEQTVAKIVHDFGKIDM